MANKSLNKVILIGNLGRDPEVRYLPSGQAVANFSLATSERFQDKENNWQERTEWHRVVFFGKVAEVVGQYLNKGSRVYVEGRIQTREWEGQDGQKRKTTEIVGQNMIMLGGRGESASSSEDASYEQAAPGADEDIPF